MRLAMLQMTSGIDVRANTARINAAIAEAKSGGADLLTTPEMAVLLDRKRDRAAASMSTQAQSRALADLREAAAKNSIWLHIGSMPLLADTSEKWVNRAFLIAPNGDIAARYDKIHLFDAELANGEKWLESSAYAPGETAVVVQTPIGRIGLAICYDVRFPALFDRIGHTNPDIIFCPAAFTRPTGAAHWHILMRARAVESRAFLVAAAQTGVHGDGRETYGHSLAIGPWGNVLTDMGEDAGLSFTELNFAELAKVRGQLPGLANRRDIAPIFITQYEP